ncbi:DNA-directed RNA polymerase III subunit RPC9 isoform X4 [Pogona vitticeps]
MAAAPVALRGPPFFSSTGGKDGNAALLSNYEVYQLLTDLKQQWRETGRSKQTAGQQNLNTIMYETLKYLSKTPCRFQDPEVVQDFLVALKSHKLTKRALKLSGTISHKRRMAESAVLSLCNLLSLTRPFHSKRPFFSSTL